MGLTLSDITNEVEQYQAELETAIPCDDVNACCARMAFLAQIQARTGHLLADAKRLVRLRKSSEIGKTIVSIAKENYLSAKAQNALVDSLAVEEMYLVDMLDRQNSDCTHQIDVCRSIVSKAKEEMRLAGYCQQA